MTIEREKLSFETHTLTATFGLCGHPGTSVFNPNDVLMFTSDQMSTLLNPFFPSARLISPTKKNCFSLRKIYYHYNYHFVEIDEIFFQRLNNRT